MDKNLSQILNIDCIIFLNTPTQMQILFNHLTYDLHWNLVIKTSEKQLYHPQNLFHLQLRVLLDLFSQQKTTEEVYFVIQITVFLYKHPFQLNVLVPIYFGQIIIRVNSQPQKYSVSDFTFLYFKVLVELF